MFACIASAHRLHCRMDLAHISTEAPRDVIAIHAVLTQGTWVASTGSPISLNPGAQGWSADDSGSCTKGWGVHAFGHAAKHTWLPAIAELFVTEKISISPLELLTTATAVELL